MNNETGRTCLYCGAPEGKEHLDRCDYTIGERLRAWAQNEEMVDAKYTEHGKDCIEAANELKKLFEPEALLPLARYDNDGYLNENGNLVLANEAANEVERAWKVAARNHRWHEDAKKEITELKGNLRLANAMVERAGYHNDLVNQYKAENEALRRELELCKLKDRTLEARLRMLDRIHKAAVEGTLPKLLKKPDKPVRARRYSQIVPRQQQLNLKGKKD